MSNENQNEQEEYRKGERAQKSPGQVADEAIAAEAHASGRESNGDSQSESDKGEGNDNPPMSRAERRAAQFNKKGGGGAHTPSAPGKISGNASGASRAAPMNKHASRGK